MKTAFYLITFALFACVVTSVDVLADNDDELMSQAEVNRIHQEQRTWQAAIPTDFANMTFGTLKKRLSKNPPNELKGRIKPSADVQAATVTIGTPSVSGRLLQTSSSFSNFDARTKWPSCVGAVRYQGSCGACWAFATVEAFEDRLCVAGKVSPLVQRSTQYLLDCAPNQQGCNGGYPSYAWQYLVSNGAPSEACYAYADVQKTCPSKCTNGAALNNTRAKSVVNYQSISAVQSDLQTYGAVSTWMAVYTDFYYYSTGVYQPTTNSFLGYHAVKVIGFGYDSYYGNYWLAQNSWGTSWGEKGFFRIKAGSCMFDTLDHFVSGWV
jgi:cathepsin B